MDRSLVETLPPPARDLVRQLEEWAGRTIDLSPNPSPSRSDALNPDALAVDPDTDTPRILYRTKEAMGPESITHELLHLRRFWLQGVPLLEVDDLHDLDGGKALLCFQLDNALEHLVIVPQEELYGAYRPSYWCGILRKFWGLFPGTGDETAQRYNAIVGWATTRIVCPDEVLTASVKTLLLKAARFESAEEFYVSVVERPLDKRRVVSLALDALGVPTDGFLLVRLDKHGGRHAEPL